MRRGAGGNGRRVVAVAAGVLAAGLLAALCNVGAAATPKRKAEALRAEQAALGRREHAALLDLYSAESRLARARATLETLRARSAELARERELARRRAEAVRSSLATARRRLARMLRSLYKQGQPDPVAILLGASSIDGAVEGIDGLRRAAEANRALIADLRRKEARARVLDASLRARTRALTAARRDAAAAVTALERMTQARRETVASLRARGELTRVQIAKLDVLARRAERRSATLTTQAKKQATRPLAVAADAPAPAPAPPRPAQTGTYTLVVDAVAYHLPGHTASGLPVGIGVVAVDPTVIPLGTWMFIPGYGKGIAADVGSAVKGNIIDLWMPSRAKALAWGRRTVTITVYG